MEAALGLHHDSRLAGLLPSDGGLDHTHYQAVIWAHHHDLVCTDRVSDTHREDSPLRGEENTAD